MSAVDKVEQKAKESNGAATTTPARVQSEESAGKTDDASDASSSMINISVSSEKKTSSKSSRSPGMRSHTLTALGINDDSGKKKKKKDELLHSGQLLWLQDCKKLQRAIKGTWSKKRKVSFKVYETKCVRKTNAVLGMMRTTKEYRLKDIKDIKFYEDTENKKLFGILTRPPDNELDLYEAETPKAAEEWWLALKDAHRCLRHESLYDEERSNLGGELSADLDADSSEKVDDLIAGLHSVAGEDWVDLGYLGKKADWLGSFRTRQFRLDMTEGILEYFHPEDDMNRIKKRSRRKWWVPTHKMHLVDRTKWEIEINCATSKRAVEADHRLTVRAQTQQQFVRVVKMLHKVGAVPDQALLPDILSSNRMNAMFEKHIVSSGHSMKEMNRHFNETVGAKVTRFVEYKVHVGEGKSPNVDKSAAKKRAAEIRKDEKYDGVIVGDMKCVVKGLFFSDKTERRRISVCGPFLCMNEVHDAPSCDPRETFMIAGMAVRMYDVWDFQFTVRGYRVKKSSSGCKLGDVTELTVQGYHEFPEQILELLTCMREEGAQLCDTSLEIIQLMRQFCPPSVKAKAALRKAMDELEKYEGSKEARGWVALSRLCSTEEIQRYQEEIRDEFTSTEFFTRYFEAATVCTKETELKMDAEKQANENMSSSASLAADYSLESVSPPRSAAASVAHNSSAITGGGHDDDRNDDEADGSGDASKMTRDEDDALLGALATGTIDFSHLDLRDDAARKKHAASSGKRRKEHSNSLHPPMMDGKHAIFVLGPSAVGKTFSTKNALSSVLEKNGWMSDMMFLSIDGGIMREVSQTWNTMKEIPHQVRGDYRYLGASDLFSTYFQSTISGMKKKLFKYCVRNGKNIIIPETAATPLPGVPSKVRRMIDVLKEANYKIVMTAVSGSRGRCNKNGKGREIQEGKKYSDISWKWASDKVTKCFNYARSKGYTKETFFITDNTDWNNVITTIVPPHFGIQVQYVGVEGMGFDYDGDTKPVYSSQQLPDIPFASMELIAKENFTVSANLDKETVTAEDQKWTEMNVQLLTYGRSVWLVWDLVGVGGDDNEDGENYICLNESRTILGADNELWTQCLAADRAREKTMKESKSSFDDSMLKPTRQQTFWRDMWLMPKVAERQIVVLDARKGESEEATGSASHKRNKSDGLKMWGSSHNLAALKAKSFRIASSSGGAKRRAKSSLVTIAEGPTPPKPPPKPPTGGPQRKARPRAKTPAFRPPPSPTAGDIIQSASECDRTSLFMQLDENGDGTLTHDELFRGLRDILPDVTESELRKAVEILDPKGCGEIHLDDFLAAYVGSSSPVSSSEANNSSPEAYSLGRRLSSHLSSMNSITNLDVDEYENSTDDDADPVASKSEPPKVNVKDGGDHVLDPDVDSADGSRMYSLRQLRMVLNMKTVATRDQWLKRLESALEAVHPDTPKRMVAHVNEYLRNKDRSRVTYLAVRRDVVKSFGEVVVKINETILEQIMKTYFSRSS